MRLSSSSSSSSSVADGNVVSIVTNRPSTDTSYMNPVVVVRDAVVTVPGFTSGLGRRETRILNGATMTVPVGTIYGLLGPSGCGKTTLLNCIVGRAKVSKGQVSVFGCPAGVKKNDRHCSRIGFMPQDIALSVELKVGETLSFYGGLLGMTPSQIKTRMQFLKSLLDLPPLDRFIDTLSGGQQRRVSLAVALIHEAELLILDEPTVGVDPILRKQIWNHLLEVSSDNKQTVLITTHYIEEARMAHTVGMMATGVVICEGAPDDIMSMYNCTSLEDAFLRQCLERNTIVGPRQESATVKVTINVGSTVTHVGHCESKINYGHSDSSSSLPKYERVRALTICNLRRMYRHIGHVLVQFAIPCLIMAIFQLSFGEFPRNIPLGVINEDERFGPVYLSYINSDTLTLKNFTSYEDGYGAVKSGETWGLLHIHSNFTDTLSNRFTYGARAFDASSHHSGIAISMDVTCQPITLIVYDTLVDAFVKFSEKLLGRINLPSSLSALPFKFDYEFNELVDNGLMGYASSGIISSGIYFVSVGLCILALFRDKSCGQLSRNFVSGITSSELVLGHMFAFFVLVLIQTIAYALMSFMIIGISCEGPIYVVILLTILHGMCGIAFGLFISSLCSSEYAAIMLGIGTFLPCVCLSGTVWPIESAPYLLQVFCYILPQTYTVDAMRDVMKRDWMYSSTAAVYGVAANLIWIATFFILSAILLRTLPDAGFNCRRGISLSRLLKSGRYKITLADRCAGAGAGAGGVLSSSCHCGSLSQRDCKSDRQITCLEVGCKKSLKMSTSIIDCASEFPIVVRNAYKSYWQRKTENPVLVDLNITIPRGVIYGLLGPSGCGKTTLLRCIVGRLSLDKGIILTLNQVPGTSDSDIPGPRIGYMPQEEALDGILKIKELLHYYGRILGVKEKAIKIKTKFLLDFLKLPSENSLFSTLSGGQKRRVSFAVALINDDAELYILDEPTVGVDPILKESIWNYLFDLVRDGKKTVVITTHYIEEARAADFVGMMFEGRLLAEDTPEQLMSKYQKSTLEDVFLEVCVAQKERSSSHEKLNDIEGDNGVIIRDTNLAIPLLAIIQNSAIQNHTPAIDLKRIKSSVSSRKVSYKKYLPYIHWPKLIAITQRNFIQLFRYPGLFLLIMVLPSFQIATSGLALGRHVLSLNFGVINEDVGHFANMYLGLLDDQLIVQKNLSTWEEARLASITGKTWGAMHFGPDFTASLLERMNKTPFVSQESLHNSIINVSLDGTNFLVSETIRYYLGSTFERFTIEVLKEQKMNPNLGKMPLVMEKPIFGKLGDPFSTFIMPAFITAASFFAQLGLSIIALFLDKEGGKLERIFIAGVTSFEIIFSFLVLQVIVLLAQVVVMLVTALVIFDLSNQGSLLLIIALTIAQGICGITLGLLISATTNDFTTAAMIAVPILVLSAAVGGYFWPMEAMSTGVKYVCQWMPFALPANAMRHIMYRQFDLLHPEVQLAFGITLTWTFIFLALAVITFRLRKGA